MNEIKINGFVTEPNAFPRSFDWISRNPLHRSIKVIRKGFSEIVASK